VSCAKTELRTVLLRDQLVLLSRCFLLSLDVSPGGHSLLQGGLSLLHSVVSTVLFVTEDSEVLLRLPK